MLGHCINFYQNSGILLESCDKINKTKVLTLPGGRQLPVRLIETTFRSYHTAEAAVDPDAAQKLLEERLLSEIAASMTEGGEILDYETTARTVDGMLQVTVEAACREQIGRAMPSAGTPSTQEGAE